MATQNNTEAEAEEKEEPQTDVTEPQGQENTEEGEGESSVEESAGETLLTAKSEPEVPEKYNLKLPKDAVLKEEDLAAIEELARTHKLSSEAAQLLVEEKNSAVLKHVEGLRSEFEKTTKQWVEEVKADKEFGGKNLERSIGLAQQVLKKYGDEKFRAELDATNFGNHPGLVRLLARIGKEIADNDTLVQPNTASQTKDVPLERVWYPNHGTQRS